MQVAFGKAESEERCSRLRDVAVAPEARREPPPDLDGLFRQDAGEADLGDAAKTQRNAFGVSAMTKGSVVKTETIDSAKVRIKTKITVAKIAAYFIET